MTTYEHLQHSIRPLADEDNESRIRRIQSDRWISYGRAELALAALENLLSFPKRTRMPNLLLVGPTNNGKTMVVEKFRRGHPPTPASTASRSVASIPVVKIQMPPAPDEPQFFGAVLEEIAFPHLVSDLGSKRKEAAVRLMRDTNVRVLIIDEVHNMLSGSRLQQRRLLNLLRWLGNELQIPLVAVGTAEALHAIQSDDQLANRFEPIALPPWRSGKEYQQLLKTLEAVLPLRRPSELAKSAIANKILSASEGILGEVVSMVTRAAILAISTGEERISTKTLDDIVFIAPSDRRRVAI
jgi:type II secretory pathway predicted ATPase ExeA